MLKFSMTAASIISAPQPLRSTRGVSSISHEGYLQRIIGTTLDDEKWREQISQSERIRKQTCTIAERLQSAGVDNIFQDDTKWVSVVNSLGESSVLTGSMFRHIQFLPCVQQAESRKWFRDLESWIERNPYCRMATITQGARCPISEVRLRKKLFSRKLSKFAFECRSWNVQVDYCRDEFTLKRETLGSEVTVHLHAHIIYRPTKMLAPNVWTAFLKRVHDFWGTVWQDCGRIQNPAECCKYLTKLVRTAHDDADTIGLMDLQPKELVELYAATKGLQFSRAFGEFAAERANRKANGTSLHKVPGPDEKSKWSYAEVKKGGNAGAEYAAPKNVDKVPFDLVLGWTATAAFSPVFVRALLVMNYCGDIQALLSRRKINWPDDRFKVHNGTITVLEEPSKTPPSTDQNDFPSQTAQSRLALANIVQVGVEHSHVQQQNRVDSAYIQPVDRMHKDLGGLRKLLC